MKRESDKEYRRKMRAGANGETSTEVTAHPGEEGLTQEKRNRTVQETYRRRPTKKTNKNHTSHYKKNNHTEKQPDANDRIKKTTNQKHKSKKEKGK